MKNKIALLSAIFFLIGTISSAQGWERTFPSDSVIGSTGLTMGIRVSQTLDDGYLMGGAISYPTGAPRDYIRLVKTDIQGNTIWQHTYKIGNVNQELFNYLNELSTGEIILAGSSGASPHVKLVDPEGEIIWEKTFQNAPNYNIQYGVEYSDDSFILMGYSSIGFVGDLSLFLMKIDTDGNLLWEKSYPTTYTGIPSGIDITSDGGFAIVGTLDSLISLVKLDSDGEMEWHQAYQVSDYDRGLVVKQNSDNSFIIGASTHGLGSNTFPVILKTSPSGGAEWIRIYSDLSGGITAIKVTPDNGYIATGAIKGFWNFSTNGFILKTNVEGEEEWSENLNLENKQIADIQITNDNGYILAGRSGELMMLKKIGGTTSIENLFSEPVFDVYPNPMTEQTIFKFEDFIFKTKQLQIYDSKGSLVFETTFSDSSFIFYRNKFNSGVYFYQVRSEGNIIGNGKLIMD